MMDADKRADEAIRYLKNTDVLASHDYVPEIHAEFIRVWNDAIEAAADKFFELWDLSVEANEDLTCKEVEAAIRKLKKP